MFFSYGGKIIREGFQQYEKTNCNQHFPNQNPNLMEKQQEETESFLKTLQCQIVIVWDECQIWPSHK